MATRPLERASVPRIRRSSLRMITSTLLPVLAFFALSPSVRAQEDETIEEVVVTGSYLKKSTADSPSPLSVVTRADIEDLGAMDIKDITNSLTYSSGSLGGSSTAFFGGDSSTGNASLNLRNLGSGATLMLINGKRTVNTDFDLIGSAYVNVQTIIPSVAVERVEIVKDGSSALYGSDAVAGVVNFITRQDFEGLELNLDFATDTETRQQDDLSISGILGASGDRGHISVSGSYLDRKELNIGDRYDRYGRSGLSTFGQPGRYVPLAPVVNTPSYFNPGSDSYGQGADPDCDLAAADDGPMGVQGNVNGLCIYDFAGFFALVQPATEWKLHLDGRYDLSDTLEFYGSATYSDSETSRNNSLYPDVNFATIGPEHFGNQLDAQRRGIAPVTLLALQRMMGGTVDSNETERPIDTRSTYERNYFAMNGGLRADLSESWTMDASVGYSEYQIMTLNRSDTLTANVNAAYVGLGGPSCNPLSGTPGSGNLGTGDCYYYNNFATSVYDPETNARWDTSDTSPWAPNPALTVQEAARMYQNPTELLKWMQGEITSQTTRSLTVVDLVFAGDIWEMPSGNMGLAIGAQYRKDESRTDLDTNSNNNNFKFIYGAQDWSNKLTTYALFAELYVPFADWGELQLAGRYEDFDELGEDTFDPKATLMITPTDDLTLRASIGTSFRVGSLLQTGGTTTTLLNSSDPFSGSGGLAFRPSITTGNPELVPEESTMWNIGLSWIPMGALEGLSVDLDYYDYDYKDLISREGHQSLIDQDNLSRCPNGNNDDPLAGPLCGTSDQNGDGVDEVYSIGPGLPDKVIRRADGGLLRTQAQYFNAPSLKTTGIDLNIAYQFDTGIGTWRLGILGSHTLKYDIIDDQGNKIDGVGSRNAGNSIGRPLPPWKVNGTINWFKDRHSALATIRYIDSYDDDVPQSALRGAYGFENESIESWTSLDLQYNFQIGSWGGAIQDSVITLGLKNATNEEPPIVNVDGGYDYFTHDPRGRIIYGRFRVTL